MDNESKTVRVRRSDRSYWYCKPTITAKILKLCDGKTVRVAFWSCDDVATVLDFSEWDQEKNYEWCKKWIYDRIPHTVSNEWMWEHGFIPW